MERKNNLFPVKMMVLQFLVLLGAGILGRQIAGRSLFVTGVFFELTFFLLLMLMVFSYAQTVGSSRNFLSYLIPKTNLQYYLWGSTIGFVFCGLLVELPFIIPDFTHSFPTISSLPYDLIGAALCGLFVVLIYKAFNKVFAGPFVLGYGVGFASAILFADPQHNSVALTFITYTVMYGLGALFLLNKEQQLSWEWKKKLFVAMGVGWLFTLIFFFLNDYTTFNLELSFFAVFLILGLALPLLLRDWTYKKPFLLFLLGLLLLLTTSTPQVIIRPNSGVPVTGEQVNIALDVVFSSYNPNTRTFVASINGKISTSTDAIPFSMPDRIVQASQSGLFRDDVHLQLPDATNIYSTVMSKSGYGRDLAWVADVEIKDFPIHSFYNALNKTPPVRSPYLHTENITYQTGDPSIQFTYVPSPFYHFPSPIINLILENASPSDFILALLNLLIGTASGLAVLRWVYKNVFVKLRDQLRLPRYAPEILIIPGTGLRKRTTKPQRIIRKNQTLRTRR